MKKLSLILICFVLFFVMSSSVLACHTTVKGNVYWSDGETPVDEADVTVDCGGNILTDITDENGYYEVLYDNWQDPDWCDVNKTTYVTATKGGASGTNSGIISGNGYINLSIVNVAIPEFATITAGLALGGAGLSYFKLRKKY